ncbi:MAG: hypothetical protein ABI041_06725, partial [Bdellovibrionia bacterium]
QGKVDWPQFMDIEAVEVFTALADKTRVSSMMREKVAKDWKKENFQTFLFAHYLRKNNVKEPFNPISNALFEDRMSDLVGTFFSDSTRQMPPNSSWREAFDLD